MQPAIGMGISQQSEEKHDVESQSDKPGGRHKDYTSRYIMYVN